MSSPSRSGVFSRPADMRVEQFTESISYDQRLYRYDIAGSRAHARMLADVGLLTPDEQLAIDDALQQVEAEIDAGNFPFSIQREDIHMHVEQALIERLGDVGRKLHTARSRNDQIATDLRLWCRDAIDQLTNMLRNVQRAFLERCTTDAGVIVPAYTHMQRAQPVLAAHYWLAYCQRFDRDVQRLYDCRRRVNTSVLGMAAVAGTSLPIDRQAVTKECGMEAMAMNSIDATCDRDFLVEFTSNLALIAIHLSGWADEWILWSTTEFGFLKPPEAYCTGSSIMPQKINPDVLELIRGRTARAIAAANALMVLLKGLPFAYHRDLQEDKIHVFAACDSVRDCLELAPPLIRGAELCRDRIRARIEEGYLDATTLMEHMIQRGVPQRSAHHHVGELVRFAMQRGVPLRELALEELQKFCPNLDASVYGILGVENAVRAFASVGSTSPSEVSRQIEWWRQRLVNNDPNESSAGLS